MTKPTFFKAGEPVARDDGRFYVPVSRTEDYAAPAGLSPIVLRVASDAFAEPAAAVVFGEFVADALNEAMNRKVESNG